LPEHQTTTYSADGLTWTDASLWQQFDALAAAAPEALAIVAADGRSYTRAEMHRMASATIAALRQHGIGAHDRVLLEGRKTAPTLAAALAISAVGGILCPFTPGLGKADRQALESRLGHVAVIGDAEGEPIAETDGLRLVLRDVADPTFRDPRDFQTVLIGFTSGTTGMPKGVMHSSAAMNYAALACAHVAGLEAGEAIIGVVPLGSAPGFTFTAHFALSQGRPLVIVDPWDAVQALALMEQHSCRWGICVPTQLVGFIEAAKTGKWTKRSPLKALAVGGSAMTSEMVADAENWVGIRVLRMFGMSECMGHASTRPTDTPDRRRNADGLPFPGTSDEAFDAELRMLPRGQRGQAGVRGPSLCLGYAQGMGDQDFRLTPDGYLLTGDEIVCDDEGYLKVVGRIKDQIIRGGYNVDPAEVEAALLRHRSIANVAVIAVPEARLGEQACAVCCVRDGYAAPKLSDLTDHLAEVGLSKKKWPEHLLIVDDMLYTATGKIDKKNLAKMAISQLGLG
jgi:acyl-CoA synthetase (AMP-forming)/AMP-acid ligase II